MKNDIKWIREQLEAHEERLRHFQLATFDALDALISVQKKLDELEELKAGTKKKAHQVNGHRFAPPMTPEEFSDWIEAPERTREDYIVLIRLKAKELDDWRYINELLQYDGNEGRYVWLSDWWEGEPFVEMLGAVPVDEVVI